MRRRELAGTAPIALFFQVPFSMPIREFQTPKINLSRRSDSQPLWVDMQGFFEFSFWMAEELLDLEAQFHTDTENLAWLAPPK